jgi:transcription initiation factor TFIIIB Brf1 subunit/transcription initiation factor TFIIB
VLEEKQQERRPRETRLWQNAYREIGRISSWLELPSYIREEMTRIYANAKKQGTVQRTSLKKQLAKITWLACLIHRLPEDKGRNQQRLERAVRARHR